MPNLNVGLFSANAATVCGGRYQIISNVVTIISSRTVNGELQSVIYGCSNADFVAAITENGALRICLSYQSVAREENNMVALNGCKLESFECNPISYYSVTEDKCISCPSRMAGTVSATATISDLNSHIQDPQKYMEILDASSHKNTTCDYCRVGMYMREGRCGPCPDSGTTDGDGHLGIERCYIASPEPGSDSTGSFSYYLNRCYYTN